MGAGIGLDGALNGGLGFGRKSEWFPGSTNRRLTSGVKPPNY